MTDMKKRTFLKLASFSALAGAGTLISSYGGLNGKLSPIGEASASTNDPLKIGFVYIGPVGDGGWSYSHDQGRKYIESVFGNKIETSYVESVQEGSDAERVFRDLVDQGNELIFGCTFGYMESMLRVAADNPDIYFEHCTGYKTASNLRVYDHRLYEAAYQAGVAAAYLTKTNILGFVGTFPIPEVLRNANAFALGARSVNPDIKVKVVWVNSWYDPAREAEAANALMSSGADILLQNTDSSAVLQAVEKAGHLGFGWDSDMSQYAPQAHLGSCVLNWGVYYEKAVNDVLDRTWKTGTTRWGTKEGLVEFTHLSNKIAPEARTRLETVQAGLKAGTFNIFEGPIVDNTGKERLAAGAVGDTAWESNVNFLVEGIEGQVPTR